MTTTLLETPHGSRLYRLNHADSDHDRFVVIEDSLNPKRAKYAKHKVKGRHDLIVCDLSTFTLYASKGIPQYLEAMWSTMTTVDHLFDMRFSFRPDYYETQVVYQRTADGLYKKGVDEDKIKFRRHAYRIILNLLDFQAEGIFNPTMTDRQIKLLNAMVYKNRDPLTYLT